MERERFYELRNFILDLEEVRTAFEECGCVEDYNATVDDYNNIHEAYTLYDIDKIKEDEEIDEYGFQDVKDEAIRTIDSIIQEVKDLFE